jgi:hypothetical protein
MKVAKLFARVRRRQSEQKPTSYCQVCGLGKEAKGNHSLVARLKSLKICGYSQEWPMIIRLARHKAEL